MYRPRALAEKNEYRKRTYAMISIVVPILNEAPRLPALFDMLDAQPGDKQTILADGGSTDEARAVAGERALIVKSEPGRARQMNAGAALAEGETILFLHCDTRLPAGALREIEDVMRAGDVSGGGFLHSFDREDRFTRFISFSANTRTRMAKLFLGDQCIFIRREVFERMGGYAEMPVFEDWDLSRRMRDFGRMTIIETPVVTSGRRIDTWGKPKCFIIWWGLSILFALGVSSERLGRYYAHVRDS